MDGGVWRSGEAGGGREGGFHRDGEIRSAEKREARAVTARTGVCSNDEQTGGNRPVTAEGGCRIWSIAVTPAAGAALDTVAGTTRTTDAPATSALTTFALTPPGVGVGVD